LSKTRLVNIDVICSLTTKCNNIFLADLFVHAGVSLRQ